MISVIFGATGTLGKEIARQILATDTYAEVRCFSRCELKQKQMQSEFKNDPRLKFILGDIRDIDAVRDACRNARTVFHVAALKHVDTLEMNPEESLKTNVIGTLNVANAAIEKNVSFMVFSSTDKAVDPVNAYGMSKGIAEKLLYAKNRAGHWTRFSVFRWGNVLGSRGSVIQSFAESLMQDGVVKVTDPQMSRFWIRIEDAVTFMLKEYKNAPLDQACIPPIKAAPLLQVVSVIAKILGVKEYKVLNVGLRPGEKLHEVLTSQHDVFPLCSSSSPEYSDAELEGMLSPILKTYLGQGAA